MQNLDPKFRFKILKICYLGIWINTCNSCVFFWLYSRYLSYELYRKIVWMSPESFFACSSSYYVKSNFIE